MDIRKQMNDIYKNIPLDKIPWNMDEPPKILVDAVESGKITPCPTVNLGCGAGRYSVWLAEQGFDVTGLDISEVAIQHATELARSKDVSCSFQTADLLGDLAALREQFDLALDWEVLHHVFPDDRPKYVENAHALLRSGGLYLSVCFSEKDDTFEGDGKFRDTPIGTTLYFSSETELRELYGTKFDVLELNTVDILGKYGSHTVNAAWMQKR